MTAIDNWREEKRSAYLYLQIAKLEKNPAHQKLFTELAGMANKQAAIWEVQLQGATLPTFVPDLRTKLILQLVKLFGARLMRGPLAAMKVRGMSIYRLPDFDHEAHIHKNLKASGNLRAAVFGVSDGLLSNVCLILGVAGAEVDAKMIIVSGIAGLLAGAFSMASGEYISVKSQKEMLEYQMAIEKDELETYPEEEAQELSVIYQARGLPKPEADRLANILIQDPDKALDTLAREELGVNPEELGSPWSAAISSFVSFAIGAAMPLLPFILFHSQYDLELSVVFTGLALFTVGLILSLFTQKNSWWSGLRLLLIGGCVGLVTFSIGNFFGVHLH